jgi:hypothetical protein
VSNEESRLEWARVAVRQALEALQLDGAEVRDYQIRWGSERWRDGMKTLEVRIVIDTPTAN